jgi:hypothetical protein
MSSMLDKFVVRTPATPPATPAASENSSSAAKRPIAGPPSYLGADEWESVEPSPSQQESSSSSQDSPAPKKLKSVATSAPRAHATASMDCSHPQTKEYNTSVFGAMLAQHVDSECWTSCSGVRA